eukprot:gnl/TRDRNA2_/TRDRNA2_80774_c0_seq2.p1 gnl/TRDRNA2_/TRDRNA2_80774_c0~~gnl/TRDRNA2_/TRDRNA2_80774_c0_seq2.p1  ORF type:complete len:488 (+),score=59.47 gnl/TRDRNA2_/TRDRNA2_80774_c0_seq2:175-1638(+)
MHWAVNIVWLALAAQASAPHRVDLDKTVLGKSLRLAKPSGRTVRPSLPVCARPYSTRRFDSSWLGYQPQLREQVSSGRNMHVSLRASYCGHMTVRAVVDYDEDDEDPWEVLGVPRGSSAADIKKAYRLRALKEHPDVSKAPDATEAWVRVSNAYDILSDPDMLRNWEAKQRLKKKVSQAPRWYPNKKASDEPSRTRWEPEGKGRWWGSYSDRGRSSRDSSYEWGSYSDRDDSQKCPLPEWPLPEWSIDEVESWPFPDWPAPSWRLATWRVPSWPPPSWPMPSNSLPQWERERDSLLRAWERERSSVMQTWQKRTNSQLWKWTMVTRTWQEERVKRLERWTKEQESLLLVWRKERDSWVAAWSREQGSWLKMWQKEWDSLPSQERDLRRRQWELERDFWLGKWTRKRDSVLEVWKEEWDTRCMAWSQERDNLMSEWETERDSLWQGWDKERALLTEDWEEERDDLMHDWKQTRDACLRDWADQLDHSE